MFEWLFPQKVLEEELADQILKLWDCQNKLSEAVHQMSICMKQMAETSVATRQDLDFLGEQMVKILEQQNRLTSQLMINEGLLDRQSIH